MYNQKGKTSQWKEEMLPLLEHTIKEKPINNLSGLVPEMINLLPFYTPLEEPIID
jgi:hypothetical protein